MNALAGFSFQLLAALVELASRSGQARQPSVFLEALSDFLTIDEGYLVVTQAKLSLRSGALRSALNELWEIHLLAQAQTPELVPHLRYAVLSSKTLLKDLQAALGRWQPEGDADAEAVAAFRHRVSIRAEADPRLTLAVLLVNAFGDPEPFRRINEWVGELLVDPTVAGFENSCRNITQDLAALEAAAREREHRFHIWGGADRPPERTRFEANPDKATLAGQTPDRAHLAEGRFARRWFYDEILRHGEDWLSNGQSGDGRLSVLWLAGRSGTGKSVALLHFLSDLQQQDESRVIIWLHQQADRLSEAIRWARPFFAEGRQVLLAADDPYTPERHQRVAVAINDALREIDSLAVAYPEAVRPSLIFCGPTEQGYLFEDDLTDLVEIEPYYLKPEGKKDIAELRQWYTERTGETDLPVGDTDEILIVQLFFEWATGGPIREFSQRFRRRLEAMSNRAGDRSLFDIFAEVLAMNRLYSLFPAAALEREIDADPGLGAAFDQLRKKERHLAFDPDRGGYRLTHPHLANAIYTTWFGRDEQQRHRKEHLRVGIEAALDHGDSPSQRFAPLWALSRLTHERTRAVHDAAQRLALIQTELREVLTEIYRCRFARSETPLVELPVWANLDRAFDLALSPSPLAVLAEAVADAEPDAGGLRLSCHTLLNRRADCPDAVPIVAHVLKAHRGWFEWHHVASHYVAVAGAAGIVEVLEDYVSEEWMLSSARALLAACLRRAEKEARAVVLRWLEVAPQTDPAWPGIYTGLFDKADLTSDLLRLGRQFLVGHPAHSSWSHVWERLYRNAGDDRAELAAQGVSWLASAQSEISGWDRVWEALWEASGRSDQDLRERGRRWLDDGSSDHPSWTYVWGALWEASGRSDRDLRDRGRRWLDEASDHLSWSFVWEALWEASGRSDRDLRDRGRRWLDEASDHLSWSFVWGALWEASGRSDQDLRERGRRWLDEGSPEHPSWSHVWEALWEASGRSDRDLRDRGWRWLDEVSPDHPSWTYVWGALWEASGNSDRDLRDRGRRWLDEASPDHPSWQYMWEALWEASGNSDRDLRDRGRRWLDEASPDHPSWKYMWEALWEASGRSDRDLSDRGRRWLDEASPDHPSWKYVWEALWEASGNSDRDLSDRGRRWLDEASPDHLSWQYMWEALWEASGRSDRDLPDRGRRWLDEASPDHPSWKYMWEALWEASGKSDRDLPDRGRRWLDEASPDHPSWSHVWEALWEASGRSDKDLRDRGRRWLDEVSPHHGSWGYIWRSIRYASRDARTELDLKGAWWLEQSGTSSKGWPVVWQILWNETEMETDRLRRIVDDLLTRIPIKAPERLQQAMERPRANFMADKSGVPRANTEHWAWKDRWSREWQDASGDHGRRSSLAQEAREWLSKFDFSQGGWTSVWHDLWDVAEEEEDRQILLALASRWCACVDHSHPRYGAMKSFLGERSSGAGSGR